MMHQEPLFIDDFGFLAAVSAYHAKRRAAHPPLTPEDR